MKKTITHAGARVPAQGRITFTRKRNGRYYIGCDVDAFACILTSVMAQYRGSPVRPLPEHARPWEILERVNKAVEAAVSRIKAGKL